jgi:parallel beta-helix repeat protein
MFRLLTVLVVFFALLAFPAMAAKRVALVIGNAEYKFVPTLLNPINDAALMENALKGAGFEVIRKDNLDQQGMKLALIEFSRTLKQGAEAGMFYYAGHGIEVDGKNYLVPIDSNMQSKDEADVYNFDVNNFMAMMENSGVPFNIMVLDACRNNPFRGLRATGGGLAPMRAPVGSYVAYATAPGSVAADGDGKNSPFTEALAASITIPGLALEEVFKQTRTKVRKATGGAQVPFDSSAIEGDFYFTAPGGLPESKARSELDRNSLAKEFFDAAGDDINKLKTVSKDFVDTAWGKLATDKINTEKERKIALAPKLDSFNKITIRLKADGSGDFRTLSDAIAAAKTGSRIELEQGVYRAGITVKKSIEIVGITPDRKAVLEASKSDTLQWLAEGGLIENLTIRQVGKKTQTGTRVALSMKNSSATLRNCLITSAAGSGAQISGFKTKPTISGNTFADSADSGLVLMNGTQATIDSNEVFGNGLFGLELQSKADPFVTKNRVFRGEHLGILIDAASKGRFEGNSISENAREGVWVEDGSTPYFKENYITSNSNAAVGICNRGKGTFIDNDLRDNGGGAWDIKSGAGKLTRENNKE